MTVKKKKPTKKTAKAKPIRQRPRPNTKKDVPKKLAKFIEYFVTHGNKLRASKQAKISIRAINRHVQEDPVFAAVYKEAYAVGGDIIESEMFRRAIEGVKKPVWHGGEKVGTVTEYSDNLLALMARGRLKETYGNNVVVEGNPDKPLAISDIGRDAAVAEISAILVAAGLRPPVDTLASAESGDGGVASPARPADPRPKQ